MGEAVPRPFASGWRANESRAIPARASKALAGIKDAIRLHIQDRLADKETIAHTKSLSLSMVEIAV